MSADCPGSDVSLAPGHGAVQISAGLPPPPAGKCTPPGPAFQRRHVGHVLLCGGFALGMSSVPRLTRCFGSPHFLPLALASRAFFAGFFGFGMDLGIAVVIVPLLSVCIGLFDTSLTTTAYVYGV